MIWVLRHISIHLWLCALFAVPFSFFILLFLTRFLPGVNPVFVCLPVIIGTASLVGILMDIAARKKVVELIKQGQAWERSGITKKAKKKYIKALRVYDTFLLWPFSARKTAVKISKAIAGFELNTPGNHQNLKLGTMVYLKMNPQDTDLARLWLSRLSRSNVVSSYEQDVLSALAAEHMDHPELSPLIANIFLGLQRTDLPAKKIYQRVMNDPVIAEQYADRIENLTGPAENQDPTASFALPAGEPEKRIRVKTYLSAFFTGLPRFGTTLGRVVRQSGLASWRMGCRFFSFLSSLLKKIISCFKNDDIFRRYFKTGVIICVSVGLLFFMISTLSHTFKTRTTKKDKDLHQIEIPKPFTIQVAAYLKLSHAQRYVDSLKKNQIDARIEEVAGGGKTWFVIRVSKFSDKKSAAEYGNQLKQQHIIEDFFVNNR